MTDSTRRDFVKSFATTAMLAGFQSKATSAEGERSQPPTSKPRPNIVIYISDQFRWDFIRSYGLNPTVKTPNLDKVVARGVSFTGAVTNQPLCSPARSCMMTGCYATQTGMWNLPPSAKMKRDIPTLASVLREHDYTANFIGKWHLGPISKEHFSRDQGYVQPEDRGGFLDLWEASNVPELTSHPYEGTYWDAQGSPLQYKDQYRVDFITERAVRFLKQPQSKPFLLVVSQIEPHHQPTQLDMHHIVAPNGYAERYRNPHVPPDLLSLPGSWQEELPNYYGCVEKIDESVGTILKVLEEQKILDSTIFLFISDHGCHFWTRNVDYKRTPHDSSIRIPFIVQGPGFDMSLQIPNITSLIDMMPTLLDAAGVPAPKAIMGKSLLPLINDPEARKNWKDRALIQISGVTLGRAIRTKEWTYCVADPTSNPETTSSSNHYLEYLVYNNCSDPAQLVNLAGRRTLKSTGWFSDSHAISLETYADVMSRLREELLEMIVESGESRPVIDPSPLFP